jgi:hypothetical protein
MKEGLVRSRMGRRSREGWDEDEKRVLLRCDS